MQLHPFLLVQNDVMTKGNTFLLHFCTALDVYKLH